MGLGHEKVVEASLNDAPVVGLVNFRQHSSTAHQISQIRWHGPLKQQLETVKIEEVKDSDYVIVLDPPEAPLQRSGPNRRKMVIFAGFLGIGLGIVIGFLKEYIENSKNKNQEKFIQFKNLISKNLAELMFIRKL